MKRVRQELCRCTVERENPGSDSKSFTSEWSHQNVQRRPSGKFSTCSQLRKKGKSGSSHVGQTWSPGEKPLVVGSSICLRSVLVRILAMGTLAPAWLQSRAHGPGQIDESVVLAGPCQGWDSNQPSPRTAYQSCSLETQKQLVPLDSHLGAEKWSTSQESCSRLSVDDPGEWRQMAGGQKTLTSV
ncbi:hypothetical protein MJG53_003854 [Ovis ammon polii x Ovis aries]|uniref:Uncharacterized protein n=1 Tax=Ovis ammon polii x Ovis aries TaxID=2918886 RepID=A0ACB9V860_9CETA|nr:hypothetical protein MJG53_003854 [Ovis ammon polii x Ovis aries]